LGKSAEEQYATGARDKYDKCCQSYDRRQFFAPLEHMHEKHNDCSSFQPISTREENE
jgi:hypothetical protein